MTSGTSAADRLLAFCGAVAVLPSSDLLGATRYAWPTGGAPAVLRIDLAVLPTPRGTPDVAAVATVLTTSLASVAAALRQPGGLVLRGLQSETAARLCDRLARIKGVQIELSEPQTATYDLFGRVDATVRRDLERLGLASCPTTGAAAAALDCGMADWLRRRHRRVAIDRRFQRFDVMLSDTCQTPRDRIADFIGLRTGVGRARVLDDPAPIRLEVGLPRGVARQFATDYAAIGLSVHLRLSGTGAA